MAAQAPAIERPAGEAVTSPQTATEQVQLGPQWAPVLGLSCELTVDLAMPDFKVGDLLKLRQGSVINSHFRLGRDLPLSLNGALLAGIEFEVVGDRLGVRLTELA
jgi:flagellar motor switch/type III secretory pathway protein FliN